MGETVGRVEDQYSLALGTTIANYDVTLEGRFLMLRREPPGAPLSIILDWTEELKRLLAKGGEN